MSAEAGSGYHAIAEYKITPLRTALLIHPRRKPTSPFACISWSLPQKLGITFARRGPKTKADGIADIFQLPAPHRKKDYPDAICRRLAFSGIKKSKAPDIVHLRGLSPTGILSHHLHCRPWNCVLRLLRCTKCAVSPRPVFRQSPDTGADGFPLLRRYFPQQDARQRDLPLNATPQQQVSIQGNVQIGQRRGSAGVASKPIISAGMPSSRVLSRSCMRVCQVLRHKYPTILLIPLYQRRDSGRH